jgi:CheY-like chemotaxis protein
MSGTIGAQSSIERGSTFWVELPVAESPHDRVSSAMGEPRDLSYCPGDRKRTILYIEDNLSNLTLVEEILADQGEINLISTMQGQLGLDLARKHLPDLILLDLHLPDLPGWEVLAQLQKTEDTRRIPVVVISADATSGQRERLKQAGARVYITKPLDIAEFLQALEATA